MAANQDHFGGDDSYTVRRQPQQGERLRPIGPAPDRAGPGATPHPDKERSTPQASPDPELHRPSKDPADELMQGGD